MIALWQRVKEYGSDLVGRLAMDVDSSLKRLNVRCVHNCLLKATRHTNSQATLDIWDTDLIWVDKNIAGVPRISPGRAELLQPRRQVA